MSRNNWLIVGALVLLIAAAIVAMVNVRGVDAVTYDLRANKIVYILYGLQRELDVQNLTAVKINTVSFMRVVTYMEARSISNENGDRPNRAWRPIEDRGDYKVTREISTYKAA